jgi:hypothetical protein
MKKFFAILAAVCLFGAMNVFADGVSNNGTQWDGSGHGQFGATIFCIPNFEFTHNSMDLGNFFNAGTSDVTYTLSGKYLEATLSGPAEGSSGASYSITYDFGTTDPGTYAHTLYTTSSGWSSPVNFPCDQNVNIYLTGNMSQVGSNSIGCDSPVDFKYNAVSLNIPANNSTTGAITFTVWMHVTVTI